MPQRPKPSEHCDSPWWRSALREGNSVSPAHGSRNTGTICPSTTRLSTWLLPGRCPQSTDQGQAVSNSSKPASTPDYSWPWAHFSHCTWRSLNSKTQPGKPEAGAQAERLRNKEMTKGNQTIEEAGLGGGLICRCQHDPQGSKDRTAKLRLPLSTCTTPVPKVSFIQTPLCSHRWG